MSFRPYPVMTLCVAVSLVILGLLGHWQWSRYEAKTQAVAITPDWTELAPATGDSLWLATIHDGRSAWRELRRIADGEDSMLATTGLVFSINPPEARPASPEDQSLGRGIVRPFPQRGGFAAAANPEDGVFYGYDRDAMGAALGHDLSDMVFEPELIRFVEEDGASRPGANPWADPALLDPLPPARHLGYALTWWGMALGLLILYFVYHLQSGRLKLRDGQ